MNNTTLGITAVAAAGVGAVAALALSDILAPKYGIILRANNTDIDSQKWTAIEQILNAPSLTPNADPRQLLYRIREFKSGTPVGNADEGELDKKQLLEDYDATVLELQSSGFTGHAFQIGVGAKERSERVPNNGPNMLHAHYRQNILESKEIVEEVNKVL